MIIDSFLRNNDYSFAMPEQPYTPTMTLTGVMCEITKQNIRIPDFQRDYIWTPEQVLELLDSVYQGYPIGSILLWKTSAKLKELNPLHLDLKDFPENMDKFYLLDGQQRIVTLYSVLNGKLELGKKRKIAYKIFFDLKEKRFLIYKKKDLDDNKEIDPKIEEWFLPLENLMKINYTTTSTSQNNDIITKLGTKPDLLNSYVELFLKFNSLQIPEIISGQGLSVATKIFERLNNTGSPLSIVDLMVAMTYRPDFNLRNKLEEFSRELEELNFGLPDRVLLQCVACCSSKGITRDDIENSAPEISKNWDKAKNSIKLALNFLNKHCSVPTSKFIPYNTMISPITYFFYMKPELQLSPDLVKRLKRYFWFGIFSDRYVQSQDTKIADDIKSMDELLEDNKKDLFKFRNVKVSKYDILFTDANFGSASSNAFLCFFASKIPLEFKNNEKINLERNFGQENQKELHHIFPQKYLKVKISENKKLKKEIAPYIDSIANISLISSATNKHILDRSPSEYFKEFEKDNKKISLSLNSHLIEDLDNFGIIKNDFVKFYNKRAKKIAVEINNFIEELKKE